MKYSSGDYLGFVNSDDILMPNALKILSRYIKRYPDVDFFFWSRQKTLGGYCMVINLGRFGYPGVFIVVTPQVFLLKNLLQKKLEIII